jgi:hypothetical protein
MQNVDMKEAANENEPLTFTQLGLAAALVINRIRNAQTLRELQTDEKQNEQSGSYPNAGNADEQRAEDKRRHVDHPLQEIPAFERKQKGVKV